MKLRILIADDHEIVRHGLCVVLQASDKWEVCGQAANGREAVAKADTLEPDLVILDFRMPGLTGLEAARHIMRAHPQMGIIILTLDESESVVNEILNAGIRGLLFKSDCAFDLITAVETVSKNQPFFPAKIVQMIIDRYISYNDHLTIGMTAEILTAREREILQLLAEGNSSKKVAALLELSVKTIETHRTNIMRKTQCHSLSQLTLYAIRNNLICLSTSVAVNSVGDKTAA